MRPLQAGDRRDLEDYEIPCNSNDLYRFQTEGAKTCAFQSGLVVDFIGRLAAGERPSWGDVFAVIWAQRRREVSWMAFVMLFVFWIWMYQVRLLIALFLGLVSFASFEQFLTVVFTTQDGILFLAIGHLVGAVLALVLFSITVISIPLLLEREVDMVTAMITSIKTVFQSPLVMLGWGVFVTLCVLAASIPFFLGLLVVLPVFGHATWHLYRRALPDPASRL